MFLETLKTSEVQKSPISSNLFFFFPWSLKSRELLSFEFSRTRRREHLQLGGLIVTSLSYLRAHCLPLPRLLFPNRWLIRPTDHSGEANAHWSVVLAEAAPLLPRSAILISRPLCSQQCR